MQKTEPDMTLIDRATSAKKTLIRISKIIKNSTTHDPESRRSETMRNIAQIIEESSNSIKIEEIVNQVYSNPEWFKSYYEISRHHGDININKCCQKQEKFIITYDVMFGDEEKWLVCEEHEKVESFSKYVLDKKRI